MVTTSESIEQEQELSRLVLRSYKRNLLEMDPHEYALFSSGSRIDVFSGATNPLSRAIHESRPMPMQPATFIVTTRTPWKAERNSSDVFAAG